MTARDLQRSRARLVLCGWAFVATATLAEANSSFDNELPARLETMTVRKAGAPGLVLVRPRIEGRHVGWFVLDTGSSRLVIDDSLADTLQLPVVLPAAFPGCDLRASIRNVSSLTLGRLTIDDLVMAALDLAKLNEGFERDFGVRVSGTIGYPVFARAVVELDFELDGDHRVALYEPASYALPRGKWQTLGIVERLPVVAGRVEDRRPGRFALDTGKAGTLSFHDGYVRAARLLEDRSTTSERNLTVCGVTREREGSLTSFELGGRRFDNPTVRFKLPGTPNARGIRGVDGSVGTGLLGEFTVIFDYSGSRVALLRARSGTDDRSGIVSVEPDRTYPYY